MKKRFLILGAGAIGSYLGGSLALAGHEVVFLEREKDIQHLQQQGILMDIQDEKYKINSPEFTSSLFQALEQRIDLVIVAVKTYHLESILPQLIPLRNILPPLLCLQNGVESEQKLAEALGDDLVIPATITTAVDCPAKGNIIVSKIRGIGIAGNHLLAGDLVEIFQEAGINSRYYPDPMSMKWSKLLTNLLGNASSAILNQTTAQIYSNPVLYRMELQQVREALKVMEVLGIKVVNLPGVPVKILAGLIRHLPAWLSQPFLSKLIGEGRGKKMPSFHIDLHSGKGMSEVDQLNGAVVRAGSTAHIPTPVNLCLTDTLKSLINGEIPLETYSQDPGAFLDKVAAAN
jgi:2-dehydropantoate 2-reductase